MKFSSRILPALAAFSLLAALPTRADNMASIAITPATGEVTLVPRWAIGGSLAGFHYMAQDLSLGGGPTQFYSIKSTPIPLGGDISAFTVYLAGSGAATNHTDIGSKLTPNSYSALTSADPDLGFGSVQLYFIHHKTDGDYFTHLVPGSGTSSAVTDLKPMSQPGGPSTGGASGYFGLSFAAVDLGYGANLFYYLRTDSVTGFTKFGTLIPTLAGSSADHFDLGTSGHNALTYTGTDVGFGINKLYFLRLDPITGFTILGTLHPLTGVASDIANLGSVYSTLTFVPGDVSFGTNKFYTTGAVNAQWQSVSFAALADRAISAGSFTVKPTASSTLPIALTVVPGSVGAASITGPVAGVFTVTPTAPGLITLQATQAGSLGSFEYNMLRQSFTATGTATLVITTQPTSQSAVTGTTASFSVVASGTSTVSYQWRKAGVNIGGANASATTANLALTNVQAADVASYDVAVTNLSGTILSNAVTLTVTTAAPIVTNSPLTAAGTVGTGFTFTITASNTPTSFTASPLPAGLNFAPSTGIISGTPTTVGSTAVLLGATNGGGTGNATLTITIAAAGVAPVITSATTAAGTVGTAFNFAITATGTPTSYGASPLPAGLSRNASTGVISGTPTTVGTTAVALTATNATGTDTDTLTITIAAAGVAPTITNSSLASAGTVGTPFSFTITAAGSPTSYTASPLPAGLSIVATTGVITGTPTTVGTTAVLLGATNATGTGNATLTITVAAAGVAPIITSATTAAGTVGTPFVTYSIVATGTPTSYGATGLPAGLAVNSLTGKIAGTPTAAGTSVVTISATNATGTDTDTLTITVAAAGVAPIITNSPLTAAGTVGTAFSFVTTATGSPTSYAASPLPAGLLINPTTGAITGTPTTAGTTAVLLGATNTTGTGNATLSITIAAAGVAPNITSATTAAGTANTPFVTYSIVATGSPTSYGATGLPAGLAVNALTGKITGTPTAAGVSIVTISATNATGTGNLTLTITIAAAGVAPIISNDPLTAAGTVGTAFSFVTTATGLPTSYAASPLPAGLLINPTTGAITGTPTTAGTTAVLLGATNTTGTGNATLSITIAAAGVAPTITSATTAAGTVNTPFVTYSIVATGSPTSYGAIGLPTGLAVNALTGKITGTPTATGVSVVTLNATNGTGTGSATLTVTVAAAGVSPIITNSPLTAAGTVGTPFSFAITASGLPTSYSASPLPAGLSIVAATGAITGTPSATGTTTVLLGATNTTGTGNATLTITVAAAAVPPTITSPITAAGTTGLPFVTYLIAATGSPTSYDAITLPAGLSVNTLTGAINGTPTIAGTTYVTLGATNANGTGHTTLKIVIALGAVAPIVTSPSGNLTGMVGTPFSTYLIVATGVPTGYSALGLPAGLSVNALTGAINGTPTAAGSFNVTLQATNIAGTGSAVLTLVIVPAPSSRIVNFSARALSGPGDQTLIMGFVVSGNGKNILVRGLGPTLADFGVVNFLSDPMLTVYGHDGSIAMNDNWSIANDGQDQSALIASTARLFGAYALPAGSKDSALLFTVNNGAHTTSMVRPNSTTGVALTEIFDIDSTAAARLVNVSARMNVSLGEGTLIAGFVIGGNAPKTLLVRGVGAALAGYGVTGVLADPQIAVYSGSTLVASDDNWESGVTTPANLMTVSSRVGAFPLAAGSKDAAVLVTLQPGAYTVHVTGVANTTGIALVEIYDTE